MTYETTEPLTLDPSSEIETSYSLDETPRRGVDCDLFWNGAV
jgi:hypothetical protein